MIIIMSTKMHLWK